MRIGINGRFLTAARVTGVERVATELVTRMAGDGRFDCLLFADAEAAPSLAGCRTIRTSMGHHRLRRHAWEQFQLPGLVRRHRVDLLFNPINTAPVAVRDQIVLIHDVAFLSPFASQSPAFRLYYSHLIAQLVRRSRGLVTVSEFSRRELIERLGARPEQVRVIRNAVSPHFKPTDCGEVLARYGVPARYLLFVGSLEPRKNLKTLLAAMRLLEDQQRLDGHQLVLVGCRARHFEDDHLEEALGRMRHMVQPLGFVADKDLPALYSGATAFVYPSLYEGFGLPPLEAMACGTPVVASSTTALPEVVGEAGLLVPPRDAEALAEAIARLLSDASLRSVLAARGRERAAAWTWEAAARQVLDACADLVR